MEPNPRATLQPHTAPIVYTDDAGENLMEVSRSLVIMNVVDADSENYSCQAVSVTPENATVQFELVVQGQFTSLHGMWYFNENLALVYHTYIPQQTPSCY